MHFVADDAIHAIEQRLKPWLEPGESFRLLPGREIAKADLGACKALFTRTVTKVDAALLDAAPNLRVVASASAGFDHVDRALLAERGIHFAHAPGCNALAVAQWVAAAWVELCSREKHCHRSGARIGVVGHGQVGRRVAGMFRALGHDVWVNDPPLHDDGGLPESRPLDELLDQCQALSFHTPLTGDGAHPTRGLLDGQRAEAFLARGGALLNTSRGEVLELPASVPDTGAMVLDVWPGEPHCPWKWMRTWVDGKRVWATPHIAGYSEKAKARGAAMAVEAVAKALGRSGAPASPSLVARPPDRPHRLAELTTFLPDHRALVAALEAENPAQAYTQLRRGYSHRCEYEAASFAPESHLAHFSPLLSID